MHGGREGEKITSVKKSCKNKGINWYMLLFLKKQQSLCMFLLRYVGGAGLGKKPCAACLGGTLSFGTFREKRKKTLTRNGDHSIKTKDLYLV